MSIPLRVVLLCEVEAERQEDLTARGQYRSELVEDDDEEDMQTDDLEEDREVYDDYDR